MKNFKVIISLVALIAVSNVKPLTMKEKIAAAKEATAKGATGATTTQEPTQVAPVEVAVAPKEGPGKKLTMKEKMALKAQAAPAKAVTAEAATTQVIPTKVVVTPKEGPGKKLTMKEKIAAKAEAKGGAKPAAVTEQIKQEPKNEEATQLLNAFSERTIEEPDFAFSNSDNTAIRNSWIKEAVRLYKMNGTPNENIKQNIIDVLNTLADNHEGSFNKFQVGIAIDNALKQ